MENIFSALGSKKIEEIMHQCLDPRWRCMADIHLKRLKDTGSDYKNTTLSNQMGWVQKLLRRNFTDLIKIDEEEGLSDSNLEEHLAKIGLNTSLLSRTDFFLCMNDLANETLTKIESEFGAFLMPLAFPDMFPPYIEDVRLVEEIAAEHALDIVEINKDKGGYAGTILGIDNYKILLEFAKGKALILYFWDVPPSPNQDFPAVGVQASVKFKVGKVTDFKFNHS